MLFAASYWQLSLENKDVTSMGDLNVDLLHYEAHYQSRGFWDKMLSASLKPHINTTTRITPQSINLIDNIFTDFFLDDDIVCGNLTCSTSDHFTQFLIYSNKAVSDQELEKYLYIKHFKNFDKRKFTEELKNID